MITIIFQTPACFCANNQFDARYTSGIPRNIDQGAWPTADSARPSNDHSSYVRRNCHTRVAHSKFETGLSTVTLFDRASAVAATTRRCQDTSWQFGNTRGNCIYQ